jgi:hypothetical protein
MVAPFCFLPVLSSSGPWITYRSYQQGHKSAGVQSVEPTRRAVRAPAAAIRDGPMTLEPTHTVRLSRGPPLAPAPHSLARVVLRAVLSPWLFAHGAGPTWGYMLLAFCLTISRSILRTSRIFPCLAGSSFGMACACLSCAQSRRYSGFCCQQRFLAVFLVFCRILLFALDSDRFCS